MSGGDERIFFKVIVHPDEDGGFYATVPTLPGVVGQGDTEEEAVRDLRDALYFTIENMKENGEPLPESDESAKGLPVVPESDGEEHLYQIAAAL